MRGWLAGDRERGWRSSGEYQFSVLRDAQSVFAAGVLDNEFAGIAQKPSTINAGRLRRSPHVWRRGRPCREGIRLNLVVHSWRTITILICSVKGNAAIPLNGLGALIYFVSRAKQGACLLQAS